MVGIGFIGWFFFVNYYMIHYRNFHSEMEHGDEDWLDPVKASRSLRTLTINITGYCQKM